MLYIVLYIFLKRKLSGAYIKHNLRRKYWLSANMYLLHVKQFTLIKLYCSLSTSAYFIIETRFYIIHKHFNLVPFTIKYSNLKYTMLDTLNGHSIVI